jgi:hypothetical protein
MSFNLLYYLLIVSQDFRKCEGFYKHPLFTDIICKMWFAGAEDEGPLFKDAFGSPGLTLQTLALVSTVVRVLSKLSDYLLRITTLQIINCIHEYKSGVFKPVRFTTDPYHQIYKDQLAWLQSFYGHNNDDCRRLLDKIRIKFYRDGL